MAQNHHRLQAGPITQEAPGIYRCTLYAGGMQDVKCRVFTKSMPEARARVNDILSRNNTDRKTRPG